MTQTKPNYKQTLNLPKTDFPMRANLALNEPQTLKRWEKQNIYREILASRDAHPANAAPFVFHDGPPYANASLHVGHLLNKVLKDIVVRSRLMAGYKCGYIPGWDCHGLPIEHRVMTDLVESGKYEKIGSLGDDDRCMAIRRECARYAEKSIKLQMGQMKRLLTLADYDDPYITMEPRYETGVLEVFAEMIKHGLVHRALKPVHWSIANQTALAEAELEYREREDPSIYVDFEITHDDRATVEGAFGVELDATPSLMIWTTTPWTLPANLAVAVHPRYRYALVEVDGNVTVIAEDLVQRVTRIGQAEDVSVLGHCLGEQLVGLTYRHPFCERTGRVVAADYVTLDDGTGLVHTAPGHGEEDYLTGQREGLDIYCPVRGDGTFDDTVPEWLRGQSVWDANPRIVDHLRTSGHLFHTHTFTHSYPHDWRSKTPVIFRCTEQWFVSVDETTAFGASLRDMAMRTTDESVTYVPAWGRNRMRGMLESRPDWCISRQRAWGLPIPAFFGPADGQVLLTAASVKVIAEVFGQRGSDAWFQLSPQELLAQYDPAGDPDAPGWLNRDGFDPATLRKGMDIFDVWFESGSSWHAVLRARNLGYPADLYLEGSDQHRGWFQLSLLPALAVTGEPPYRTLVTHGFIVNKEGRKMSKSAGDALTVDDLLKDFGADVCRWWVGSLNFEGDIKLDVEFFNTAGEEYRKVRNTLRFLLSNLADFDPSADRHELTDADACSLDAMAMVELNQLIEHVLEGYSAYSFRKVHGAVFRFCNETMSSMYLAAVKDRLYCDRTDSRRRRRTQTVMYDIVHALVRLIAPILPHTAEEAWTSLHRTKPGEIPSVNLELFPQSSRTPIDHRWPDILKQREAWLRAIEQTRQSQDIDNPLDCGVVLRSSGEMYDGFDSVDFADLCGISRFELVRDADAAEGRIEVIDLRSEPRCERSWKRDGTVSRRSDGGMLSDRDAEAISV